jgi:hypothetical protein
MGKRQITLASGAPLQPVRKRGQVRLRKDQSHNTFTAKRHPNSKRVRQS